MTRVHARAAKGYEGEVTLGHTKQGVPCVRLYLGTSPVTGKRIRPYRAFPGMDDEAALVEARKWADEVSGDVRDGMTKSVRDMLTKHVDRVEAMHKSPNTVKTYRLYARRYVAPIAGLLVPEVMTEDVDDLLVWLLTEGPNMRPLSPMTVKNFRFFLEGAFSRFARLGVIEANPVMDSIRPEVDAREAMAMDEETASRVLAELDAALASGGTRKADVMARCAAMAALLALSTGMRCGEVCGLRWRDLRERPAALVVSGTVVEAGGRAIRQERTKGKKTRVVSITDDLLSTLECHRVWQGALFKATAASPIVSADGSYMRPSYISRRFTELRRRLGLSPLITFHTLRHTHATWLLQDGMNIRDIQERLGHAYVDTTLSAYGHVLPGRDALAAKTFASDIERIRKVHGKGRT